MTYVKPILPILAVVLVSLFATTTAYSENFERPEGLERSESPEHSFSAPIRGLTIQADQLPRYYPPRFRAIGSIFRINDNGQILVSGSAQAYTLSTNVLIHSMSTEFSSRHALRKGAEIGFSVNNRNRRTITEIWILPEGAIRPS